MLSLSAMGLMNGLVMPRCADMCYAGNALLESRSKKVKCFSIAESHDIENGHFVTRRKYPNFVGAEDTFPVMLTIRIEACFFCGVSSIPNALTPLPADFLVL